MDIEYRTYEDIVGGQMEHCVYKKQDIKARGYFNGEEKDYDILNPLTFLIYINDITENIKSNIKFFADDTSLYVTINEDAATATSQLNDDLSQICKWADSWLVKFNADNQALTVTLKRNLANIELPLSCNNTILETVEKHKHLGVELSTDLSWKDHITTISENAGKKIS